MSNVKGVFERVPSKKGPKMAVFGAKGGEKLNFWFCDPQKARPCAEPRLLTYFASKCLLGYLFVLGFFKSPTAKTPAQIFTQNMSKDAVPHKDVPFGGRKTKS